MAITTNVSLIEYDEQILQVSEQQMGATQSKLLQKTTRQQARQRFERHFGTLSADYAGSAENEQIDADLAQAYAA